MCVKILIIEDDKALRRVLHFRLSQESYHVLVAEDGEAGPAMVRAEMPDLVLLDLIMPKMNGFETLRRIKSDESLRYIPVIVLSNLNHDGDLAQARELGAVDFVFKTDFSMDQVVERVQRALDT